MESAGNGFEEVSSPLIYDLVEVNLAHYRNSADFEREIHRIAVKTAIFPGWRTDELGQPEIGGALATPPDQTPFILESKSASPIHEEMRAKEERMIALGAQLMQKRDQIETAETARIHSRGESSVIASMARAVSSLFSHVLTLKANWSGFLDTVVSIDINTDFDETTYEPGDIKEMWESYRNHGISFHVFFNALKKLELYPPEWTKEDELEAIQEDIEREMESIAGSEEMDSILAVVSQMQQRLGSLEGTSAGMGEGATQTTPEDDE